MIKEKFGDEETPRSEKSKSSKHSHEALAEEKDIPLMPGEKEYIKLLLKGFTREKEPIDERTHQAWSRILQRPSGSVLDGEQQRVNDKILEVLEDLRVRAARMKKFDVTTI